MNYVKTTELYHHGVQGQKWGVRNGPPYPLKPSQKWGVRNGPPYPLKSSQKSAVEKKASKARVTGGEESKMAKLRRHAAENVESIKKAPYKTTLHAHMSKDERRPGFTDTIRHPAKSVKEQYQISAEKFAKERSVGQILTQTILTNIGLTAAATAIKIGALRSIKNEEVADIVDRTVNGVFGSLLVANTAVGITAAVQKGRGRYDNNDDAPKFGGVKDMSNEQLSEYNKRRALEEKYNEYQRKDDKSGKKLSTAADIANKTRDAYNASERSVNDMFREQHRQQKESIDLSNMSDDELRRRVNRMNMERQYRDMTPAEVSRGEQIATNAMSILGPVLATTASALSIAVGVKTLINKK